ncbi:MAG: hypothetical protein ACYS0H_19395 [Planctomycetota bacterium]
MVTGSEHAGFKQTATTNGSGKHKSEIWARDGGKRGDDTFHIKIWTEDESGVETVVYDSGPKRVIGGGSIVIQTKQTL